MAFFFSPLLMLTPYTGEWKKHQAAHLLRRTTYGSNIAQINEFASKTLNECLDDLTAELPMPDPPINYNFENDPDTPIGETWVDKGITNGVNGYRIGSLNNWSLRLMYNTAPHIREKMTLFWHNHFVVADLNDARYTYKYITLLRAAALGNFRQLTKDVTIDPAMLNFLNGRDNTRQAPNENYARELLELFTLGKGDAVGDGDYTTYTERDVLAISRVLTGWMDIRNNLPIRAQFFPNRHDTGNKQLSHRFNNTVITNNGENEYKDLIDLIFQREEVSLFICRKLYVWFVFHEITEEIEQTIIEPMAQLLRDNNYEIKPVVKALLGSQHFYETSKVGCMIKNPIDFMMTPLNVFNCPMPDNLQLRERVFSGLYGATFIQQMALFQAPSVAGWQAYYQAPLFYRLWLNAFTLPVRKTYTDAIANLGIPYGQFRLVIDPAPYILQFENPQDIDSVIHQMALVLFPNPLQEVQLNELKSVMMGITPFNQWPIQLNSFIDDQTNVNKKLLVNIKLKSLITYMMRMPEFHLS